MRSVSNSVRSLAMEALVLLYAAWRSSISVVVSSDLHLLMILDQWFFSFGLLVLLMLNLKSTLVGYWFLANLPSITLMVEAKESFFL